MWYVYGYGCVSVCAEGIGYFRLQGLKVWERRVTVRLFLRSVNYLLFFSTYKPFTIYCGLRLQSFLPENTFVPLTRPLKVVQEYSSTPTRIRLVKVLRFVLRCE